MSISSISLVECLRAFLSTLLHGSLLLEIRLQKNLIGVLLLPLQLNLTKIGVLSIQTTKQYRRKQRTGDSYFQTSTTFRSVVNIIQTEKLHSLLENPNWLSILEISQVLQHFYFQKISILQPAIQYESSGITGIATYKGAFNFSGANWFSQAVQHRSFGLEGEFTISGTGNESITPFIPEGSGSLFKLGGAAESSTKAYLVGDYQYLSGNADTTLFHMLLVLVQEHSVRVENLIRHTLVRLIFLMMSWVEFSPLLVRIYLRRIQILIMNHPYHLDLRMKIMVSYPEKMLVVDLDLTFLVLECQVLILLTWISHLIVLLQIKPMMRQLVVLVFSHHLIRINNTISILPPTQRI